MDLNFLFLPSNRWRGAEGPQGGISAGGGGVGLEGPEEEEAVAVAAEVRAAGEEEKPREALEVETASKQQEIAAAEKKFIADSKVTENSLKEIRERLDGDQMFLNGHRTLPFLSL